MKKKLYLLLTISAFLISSCSSNNDVSSSTPVPSSSSTSEIPPTPTFVVKWLNYDGTVLEIDENVSLDTVPTYDGNEPTRESDKFEYAFKGWTPEIVPVKENATYTATYDNFELFPAPSKESGFYDEPFELSFSQSDYYDIYYTFNFETPTLESTKYTSPISIYDRSNDENYYSMKQGISSLDVFYPTTLIDKCTTLKVIYVDKTNNEIVSQNTLIYFIGFNAKNGYDNLPIVCLDTPEANLYDYETGIYVNGKIYDESPHTGEYPETYPTNYRQRGKEWERQTHLSYFNECKELEFEQEIGIRIHGGWTRAFNQKSFNLYARKEYDGNNKFKKAFFNDINAHSLVLRSGGYRDTFYTKTRDSLSQTLTNQELFDVQNNLPCIVFLNGEYWGIYNLQEKFSEDYLNDYYGVKKKNVLIMNSDEIDEGSEEDYHFFTEWKSYFQNNSFYTDEKYEEAQQYVDVEEFAQYMACEMYIGNIDWPANNQRAWREVHTDNTQWHFMIYDMDDSMSMVPSMCSYEKDPFIEATHWAGGPLATGTMPGLILVKLLQNDNFKHLFKDTLIRYGTEIFSSKRVNAYLNKRTDLLTIPMENNYRRFVSDTYDGNYFIKQIDIIRNFFDNRYEYMMSFFNEHVSL